MCYKDFNKVQIGTHIAHRFHVSIGSILQTKKIQQQKKAQLFLGFLRTKVNKIYYAAGYVVLRAHFATN